MDAPADEAHKSQCRLLAAAVAPKTNGRRPGDPGALIGEQAGRLAGGAFRVHNAPMEILLSAGKMVQKQGSQFPRHQRKRLGL